MSERIRRILVIIGDIALGGGAQRVAATVSNQLAALGHEAHVLTFYHHPSHHHIDGVYHSFHERPARNFLDYGWKLLQRSWRIRRACKKHGIDLTISFMEEANACALFSKIAFWNRIPMIVSVRNNALRKSAADRILIRFLYPFANRVVSVSRGVEEMLREHFGLGNTTTVYNPVDAESVREKAEEPLPGEFRWIEGRAPLFVTAGRLVRQKGHWHLIRAFQKVVQGKPGATLLILGKGELRGRLESLIRECGLEKNVFLPGYFPNVFPFLRAADGFVFSSLWEGMPNALLDALAVGLPILSTDCPTGPREILAPELGLDEEVFYPYETSHGTLLTPLPGREVFAPIARVPLSPEEEMLAGAMAGLDPRRETPSPPAARLARFRLADIVAQWRDLI